jgi:hypothetical protein
MDISDAGKLIAEQMDAIEKDFGASKEHSIGAVITIVEVVGPEGTQLRLRTNLGGQPYRLLGYLAAAQDNALEAVKRGSGSGE